MRTRYVLTYCPNTQRSVFTGQFASEESLAYLGDFEFDCRDCGQSHSVSEGAARLGDVFPPPD